MASASSLTYVQKTYIAYYGRAADPLGQEYWAGKLDVPGATLAGIIDAFGNSAEATTLFSGMSNAAKVNAIYKQCFGRDADVGGLTFYANALTAGTYTHASIMLNILNGATGTDATAVANKLTAANLYTAALNTTAEIIAYSGNTAAASARTFLATVTDVATTVPTAAAVDTSVASMVTGATAAAGQTYTLTDKIDTFTGTVGNDTFIGDAATAGAADQLAGGTGTDILKLYGTVTLPTISGIENIYVNGSTANLNIASQADVTSLTIDNIDVMNLAPTYTLAATQSLTLQNIIDGDADNTDGVEVASAATVTAQTLKLNKVGDSATGGLDVNIDINGAGVATLNVDSSTAASRVSIENTGTLIRTLNISGDAAITIEANAVANNVGALATAINITNTAGATVTSSATPSATTGLVITAVGGKDTVTLAQAAGANALTNKVAVDLGAGDDTLTISALTAATDIQDGASFKGGDGTDTLKLFDGDIIDATRGKLFSGFEIVDVGGAQATTNLNLALLAANNTITTLKVGAALTAAVSVTNLPETAGVLINAALGNDLTINQKDSGAGSPDDVITLTYDSKTAIGASAVNTTIADIETVNINATSTGTGITHTISQLVVNNATKIVVNASTAGLTLTAGFTDPALVLFDASPSAKAVSLTTGTDAFAATAGVAFKGGAGGDTFVLTGASTGAATGNDLDFLITGGAGADTITLPAVTAGKDIVVYTAQTDSTNTKFDSITNFDATAASFQDYLDLKAFGFTGNQQGVKDFVASGITIEADGSIKVASGSTANFFVDVGLARGVATWDGGADTYVFVDVSKDGNWDSATDMVIKLVGVGTSTDITGTDIQFA